MSHYSFRSCLRLRCMDIIGHLGEHQVYENQGSEFGKEFAMKSIRESVAEMQAALDEYDAEQALAKDTEKVA